MSEQRDHPAPGLHRAGPRSRPVLLTVAAVLLAVFGVSTITYAVTREDPNAPPGITAGAAGGPGVPVPVLPDDGGSAAPTAPARATPRVTSSTPPPLPEAQVVPLIPTSGPRGTPTATPKPTTTATPRPTPTRTATPTPTPTPTGSTLPAPLNRSGPVRVVIGKLGVDRRPIALGLTGNNELQVPDNADDLGWWTGGPTPGQVGAAVIAGHVSYNRPGVFYRLATLSRGDTIAVTRKDGKTATFTVSGTKMYPKDAFPTADVYGFVHRAALRLITCGGTFDPRTRHFEENIVVYADMTSVTG